MASSYILRRTDVLGYMAEVAGIHVSDFCTLAQIVTPTIPTDISIALSHTRVLIISMKLPLEVFADIENSSTHAWNAICNALPNLKNLQKVNIWLDHLAVSSRTHVNERAFIAPLVAAASTFSFTLSINLPNLHPKHENPERHFLPESYDASPICITRRLRNHYHGVIQSKHGVGWRDFPDFPILWGEESDSEVELEDMERMERRDVGKWDERGGRGECTHNYCV